ncbi:hypothetical protein MPTK2_7g11510 [Marchantia polymorpha subsp. ruderalis]
MAARANVSRFGSIERKVPCKWIETRGPQAPVLAANPHLRSPVATSGFHCSPQDGRLAAPPLCCATRSLTWRRSERVRTTCREASYPQSRVSPSITRPVLLARVADGVLQMRRRGRRCSLIIISGMRARRNYLLVKCIHHLSGFISALSGLMVLPMALGSNSTPAQNNVGDDSDMHQRRWWSQLSSDSTPQGWETGMLSLKTLDGKPVYVLTDFKQPVAPSFVEVTLLFASCSSATFFRRLRAKYRPKLEA